jgi:small subunit ribosomal protein S14
MATVAMVQKNLRRKTLSKKYAATRKKILEQLRDKNLTNAERFQLQIKLQKLPRNSSPVRIRNRCAITGRPRGYFRDFDLGRTTFRECASFGFIPGVKKGSW